MFERKITHILVAALFAMSLVLAATFTFLAKDLPEETVEPLMHPSLKLDFAFGSGKISEDQVLIDEFVDGYALLSSGPVSIQASSFRMLRFTWQPSDPVREAAFFWRRSTEPQNLIRIEITTPGFNLKDLATEPGWRGEITEFGFLVAGRPGESIEMGQISLQPESLRNKLKWTWQAWTVFEEWSQKSINFLNGGAGQQPVSLPLLVIAWLVLTIVLLWLLSLFDKKIDSRHIVIASSIVFLAGWILLDLRWTSNNLQQIRQSLQTLSITGDQQRFNKTLDGELYDYAETLKSDILGDETARILIIGEDDIAEYYMLRVKYHLLPHSVNIAGKFGDKAVADSLDFVLFFGQPGEIMNVPGWNPGWRQALSEVERGDWAVVYRVNSMK